MFLWHLFRVRNHELILDDKESFQKDLIRFEGKQGLIGLKSIEKWRTLQQNRYYWGIVIEILRQEFGYSKNEMHEALRWEFLRMHKEGKPDTVKSTTDLNTVEFNDYCKEI